MRGSTIVICFLALTMILLVRNVSLPGDADDLTKERQECQQDMQRVEALGRARDLKGLKGLAPELERKWRLKSMKFYGHVMLELCNRFGSEPFKEGQQYALAERYALLTLHRGDDIPLDVVTKLLLWLQQDTEYYGGLVKGGEYAKQRSARIKLWLRTWHRIESGIDKDWDPEDLPLLNIPPPVATGLPSGVAPRAIKDPKLRAEYEAALEKNRQKAQKYDKQYTLRKLQKRFLPKAERYIVRAYSRPPFNLPQLKQYLEKYIADKHTRARILDAVEKNMAEKSVEAEGS